MTKEDVLLDMYRIGGDNKEIDRAKEQLRITCHRNDMPYHELWASRMDTMPRYLVTDVFSNATKRGTVQIQDMRENRLYTVEYAH